MRINVGPIPRYICHCERSEAILSFLLFWLSLISRVVEALSYENLEIATLPEVARNDV